MHPRRRSGRRDRSRRGRTRRRDRFSRARLPKWRHCPQSLTGDYLAGPARRRRRRQSPPPDHGWIRLAGARGNNLKEPDRRVSAGRAVPGDRRQRLGQKHAGGRHALSRALPPACARRPRSRSLRRRFRRRPDRRVITGRSKPDRPLAALESRHLHQGVRRNPQRVRRYARSPHPQLHGQPFQLQRRWRPLRRLCRATAICRSTCSFWPTCYMKCPAVQRHAAIATEILKVTYRGRNIAEVLEMTVREAFTFFRGQPEGASPAQTADRRGAGLRAARPAGQHALRRRGAAAEARRLHVGRQAQRGRCSSSTSRPPACTSPTSCNCSIASRRCWPLAIR